MSYQVVRADVERDKDVILRFWRENSPKPLDSKYRWMYENNPAGKPIVWVIRHVESGECVGMTSLFPRRMSWQNDTILAGVTGDLLVSEKHRTLGPAMKLLRNTLTAVQDGNVDLIYTFPNPAADGVARAAGYRRLGRLVRMVRVLKAARHLQAAGMPAHLSRRLGPALDWLMRVFSIEFRYAFRRHIRCRETNAVDASYRSLWNQQHLQYEIAGERTEDYLQWKFLSDPDDENRIYAAFDASGGGLLAYLVYRFEDHGAEVREYVVGRNPDAGAVLMARFFRYARQQGKESVSVQFLENEKLIQAFQRLGFKERHSDRNVYVNCSERIQAHTQRLGAVNNWLLMASDQDT